MIVLLLALLAQGSPRIRRALRYRRCGVQLRIRA